MYSLSQKQQQIIEGYLHIKFGPYDLPCPYFMNKRGRRNLSVVDAGKGTPEEIESELKVWHEKYKNVIKDEGAALIYAIHAGQAAKPEATDFT